MVRKTRKLKGGKFVTQGSYGCVYRPAMKCKGNAERTPNAISKLMQKKDAEDEFQKRSLLEPVDPEEKYVLWPKRICSVGLNDLTDENSLRGCFSLGVKPTLEDAALLLYGDGGTDVERIKLKPSQYSEFFKGFEQLFEGLALLHSNNIVHLDIKPANIVAKEVNGTFQFHYIDYSFTTSINAYNKANIPNGIYRYWPYEFRFAVPTFEASQVTVPSATEWLMFVDYLEIQPLIEGLTGFEFYKIQKENYDEFIKSGETREQRLGPLLKAVDVYSLGISMLKIYRERIGHFLKGIHFLKSKNTDDMEYIYNVDKKDTIYSSKIFLSPSQRLRRDQITKPLHYLILREVSTPFLTLLGKMVTFHLGQRITAQQAYDEFQRIKSKFDLLKPSLVKMALQDQFEHLIINNSYDVVKEPNPPNKMFKPMPEPEKRPTFSNYEEVNGGGGKKKIQRRKTQRRRR